MTIYQLIELHDALQRQGARKLAARALEEARWGVDWSLRCRFGPGLRVLYGEYSYYTDSVAGTKDDVVQDDGRSRVGSDPFQNALTKMAAARAARTLKQSDAKLAARLFRAAREDFAELAPGIKPPTDAEPLEINVPTWRDLTGYVTLAASELYRATGDAKYADEAARFATLLTQTQERRCVDDIAITGCFYEDAGRTRIVHEYHNSFEDCGLLAFAALCQALPDHPDWMNWYAGLVLYADHFCVKGGVASAPFDVVPAAVWRRADLDAPLPPDQTGQRIASAGPTPVFPTVPTPKMIHGQMTAMFEDAADLGADYRLRVLPLWSDHIRHGATTVQMSKTIGLAAAAEVMGRPDLSELAARQVQWTVGANPLSRSLIYGVSNDFWQNFTVALPNIVGGMSLGFNSYHGDAPAWGNNATFPYKEMWVYSSRRIALNLARIGIPSRVSGRAPEGVAFRNLRTGESVKVRPGYYAVTLPAGNYEVTSGGQSRRISLAHASERRLDVGPAYLAVELESGETKGSTVALKLSLKGRGSHRIETRVFNARIVGLPDHVMLDGGTAQVTRFTAEVLDPSMPWIVTVIGDGDLGNRAEASVTVRELRHFK